MTALIKNIFISKSSGLPLFEVSNAQLINNKGIQGDRYHDQLGKWSDNANKPDFNLSLIEHEKITIFHEHGITLSPAEYRRNIVTQGVDLNSLVGKHFSLGGIHCYGVRLCEPCRYLEELTSLKLVREMAGKGGLRAQILSDGIIQTGDPIISLDPA